MGLHPELHCCSWGRLSKLCSKGHIAPLNALWYPRAGVCKGADAVQEGLLLAGEQLTSHLREQTRNETLAHQEDAGPEKSYASRNDQMSLESNNRGAVDLKQKDQWLQTRFVYEGSLFLTGFTSG